jgi:hypothetical protein
MAIRRITRFYNVAMKKTVACLSLLLPLWASAFSFAQSTAPAGSVPAPAKKAAVSLTENDAEKKVKALPEFLQYAKNLGQRSSGRAQAQVFVEEDTEDLGPNKYWQVTVVSNEDGSFKHWARFLVRLDGKEMLVVDLGVGEILSLKEWRTHVANR